MNVTDMLQAIESQDEPLSMGLTLEERVRVIVGAAPTVFSPSQIGGLIRRAKLRYPNADLRQVALIEERGLNRNTLTAIGGCTFIEQNQNMVFQAFRGPGKSLLGCALAKQACRDRIRTQYARMSDLEEQRLQAQDKPLGASKFQKKYRSFTLLVVDEWLRDPPSGDFLRMLLELMERCCGSTSTLFCAPYRHKARHRRLFSGVHFDAVMFPFIPNTIWIETGSYNMERRSRPFSHS